MYHYDRIEVSESIDANKASEPKECDVCHYWYILTRGFKFQVYVCTRCDDFLMMCINFSDIPILNIKSTD